jgi:dihydrofolate reductase
MVSSALGQARAAAGDKRVAIAGGASIIQQLMTLGLLDELQIHVVPILLGGGRRLFDGLVGGARIDIEPIRVIESPDVTHLRYRLTNGGERTGSEQPSSR